MLLPDCAEGAKIVTRKGTASERMLPTGGGCNQGGPAAGPASRFVYKFSKRSERERDYTQYRLYIAFPLITMFIHLMRRTTVYKRATHFQDAVIFRWANIKAPVSAKGVHKSVGKSITTTAPRAVLIHILLH